MEILNSVYLERNPNFLSIRKDKIRTKDGLVIDNYIVAESKNWVNAVVLTKDNQIVLVKQYRHGIEQQTLEIPAGAIEEGETPEEAIIREVSEETGYTFNKPPIFLGDYYVNPANFNNSIFCYLITDAELKSEQCLDETEFIDVFKYSFKDIETLIESDELKQLFSVHSVRLVQNKLSKEEKSL